MSVRQCAAWAALILVAAALVLAGQADNVRLFSLTMLNGVTLAALCLLAAHGSLYLLGAYFRYACGQVTGCWSLADSQAGGGRFD